MSGLTEAQLLELKNTNPILYARVTNELGVRVAAANEAPDMRDGRARVAAMRGEGSATSSEPTETEIADILAKHGRADMTEAEAKILVAKHTLGQPKAMHAELKKINPVLAARYAAANGLHDK